VLSQHAAKVLLELLLQTLPLRLWKGAVSMVVCLIVC
jgi:hypothetical protein